MEAVTSLVTIFTTSGYCGYSGKKLCSSRENSKKKKQRRLHEKSFFKIIFDTRQYSIVLNCLKITNRTPRKKVILFSNQKCYSYHAIYLHKNMQDFI